MKKKIFFVSGSLAVLFVTLLVFCGAETVETNQPVPVKSEVGQSEMKEKVLVCYFTFPETDGVDASSGASRVIKNDKLYGSTAYIAQLISESTGGDLFEIKTIRTYPGTHKELIDAAKSESENKLRPKLATHINNLNDYDIIFIGYPNWWYDMPMPLYSFFEEYDFTGKTVIPFCTHGGSRFSQSIQTIKNMEKGAKVIQGPSVSRDNVANEDQNIQQWLDKRGFKK